MKRPQMASGPKYLVCPLCESGEPQPVGHDSARCDSCGGFIVGWMLKLLRQVAALPDALGGHACECGHPEMRFLPDGIYHCPACGSEVFPLGFVHLTDLGPKTGRTGCRGLRARDDVQHANNRQREARFK